jgi:hypothetical protein
MTLLLLPPSGTPGGGPVLTVTTAAGLVVSVNAAPPVQWYINGVPIPVAKPDVSLTLAPGQAIVVNGVAHQS